MFSGAAGPVPGLVAALRFPWQAGAAPAALALFGLGGKYIKEALDWEEDDPEEIKPAAFLLQPLDMQKMAAQINSRACELRDDQLTAAAARGALPNGLVHHVRHLRQRRAAQGGGLRAGGARHGLSL